MIELREYSRQNMTPRMRAKNHKHLIQLQTRTGISVLSREMRIQHVSGFPCCISSVRSTSVILQLFDPLRFSTSCFSFANVRKKKNNKKQLRLTPGRPSHTTDRRPVPQEAQPEKASVCAAVEPGQALIAHHMSSVWHLGFLRGKIKLAFNP